MSILTKNPEVWKKTIFIINYDENDGYFDHIPPFVPPETGNPETGKASFNMDNWLEFANRADEMERLNVNEARVRTGPVGLGFRVLILVLSHRSRCMSWYYQVLEP